VAKHLFSRRHEKNALQQSIFHTFSPEENISSNFIAEFLRKLLIALFSAEKLTPDEGLSI
jgi:hypothetical protein